MKAYKWRIFPDKETINYLNQAIGSARFIYNFVLGIKKAAYDKDKVSLSVNEIKRRISPMKKTEEYSWLNDISSSALNESAIDVNTAYVNYFENIKKFKKGLLEDKPSPPKFKNKYGKKQSIRMQHVKFFFTENRIQIPKVKKHIVCRFKNYFPEPDIKLGMATIKRTPTGKYYISVFAHEHKEKTAKPPIKIDSTLGIDVGIKNIAILSDGKIYANLKLIDKYKKRIAYFNRELSRRVGAKKGSKKSQNFLKTKKKLAKLYEKIANTRDTYYHQITSELVKRDDVGTFAMETLKIKNMVKNRKLSKAISDASWFKFKTFLKYKSEWNGKNFVEIDQWFASSKTCSVCGHKLSELKLSKRFWTCPECKTEHDRDINAAINIGKEAVRMSKEPKEKTVKKRIKKIVKKLKIKVLTNSKQ